MLPSPSLPQALPLGQQSDEKEWKFPYMSGQILCGQRTRENDFSLLIKVKEAAVPLLSWKGLLLTPDVFKLQSLGMSSFLVEI